MTCGRAGGYHVAGERRIVSCPRRRWAVASLVAVLLAAGCAGAPPGTVQQPVQFPAAPEPARFFSERTVYGTGDLEPETDEDRLQALLTGASKKTGTPFAKPFDVAVHRGRVFVSDTVRQIVFALDFPQHKSFQIGNKGDAGDLGKPLGIAVDAQGMLYVVDSSFKRVMVYDRDGNFRSSFGSGDTMDRPTGIAVTPGGTRAYVVDVGGVNSSKHQVHAFDTRSGKLLFSIGDRGRNPGQMNLPRDAALAANGTLYVSDGGNFRVQAFTGDGVFLREWGKPGMRFGQFSRPKGIATDPQGNVYVVDAAFGNFQIFDPVGRLLLFIGRRSEQDGPGVFMLPAGIDVDEDGRIYVIDQYYRKLEIFRPAHLAPEEGFLAATPAAQK